MIKKELWYCRSRFHSSFFGGNQMKIKRLKRPFVLILAFVLLLSSISQSVSAADTGQVINYPSLPIFKGKSFNAFGKSRFKGTARKDSTAFCRVYFLTGQPMNRFDRQQHDPPALIRGKQKTRTWCFLSMRASFIIAGDENGIAPVPLHGTQEGIKLTEGAHESLYLQ